MLNFILPFQYGLLYPGGRRSRDFADQISQQSQDAGIFAHGRGSIVYMENNSKEPSVALKRVSLQVRLSLSQ